MGNSIYNKIFRFLINKSIYTRYLYIFLQRQSLCSLITSRLICNSTCQLAYQQKILKVQITSHIQYCKLTKIKLNHYNTPPFGYINSSSVLFYHNPKDSSRGSFFKVTPLQTHHTNGKTRSGDWMKLAAMPESVINVLTVNDTDMKKEQERDET